MIAEIGQIGYFDPDYQAPANSKGSTYLAADRQYIYHDVFVFTARLQTRLAAVGAVERTLKTVLPKCLCNSAWIWYDEMSDHKKDLLNNVSQQAFSSPHESFQRALRPICAAYLAPHLNAYLGVTTGVTNLDSSTVKHLNVVRSPRSALPLHRNEACISAWFTYQEKR